MATIIRLKIFDTYIELFTLLSKRYRVILILFCWSGSELFALLLKRHRVICAFVEAI